MKIPRHCALVAIILAINIGVLSDHVHAQTIFSDRFETPGGEPGEGVGWLATLTLSGSQAKPFGYLLVHGLPDETNVQDLYVVYNGEDISLVELSETGTSAGVLIRREDAVYLPIPVLEPEGSQVTVIITDGHARSPTYLIDIEALPAPKQGAADEALAAVEALLKAATEFYGLVYPDEWIHWREANLEGMPIRLLPIMEIWDLTFNEENPNSLIAMPEDDESIEFLERILTVTPTVRTLRNLTTFFETDEDELPRPVGPFGGATERHGWQINSTAPALQQMRDRPTGPVTRLPGEGSINSPEQLASLLETYQTARRVEQELELLDDIFLSHIGTLVAIASLPVSKGSSAVLIPLAREAAIKRALKLFKTIHGVSEAAQWFLPCCLRELEATLAPDGGVIWFEDAQPNQIRLLGATVTAESQGVNFAQKFAERIVGIYGDLFASELLHPKIEEWVGDLPPVLVGDLGSSAEVTRLINNELNEFPVVVFEWTGVDVMGDDPRKWLNVEINTLDGQGTPIIEQAPTPADRMEFRLRTPQAFERDKSTLRFSTNIDNLPARNTALDTSVAELKRMNFTFDRPRIRLQPDDFQSGDPIELEVTVEHTVLWNDELEWALDVYLDPEFPSFAVGEIELVAGSCRDYTCTLRYWPGDEAEFPSNGVLIKVDYVGDSGIFSSPQAPIRRGINSIVYNRADLIVEPDAICIQAGTSQQFTARDGDTNELIPSTQLQWAASRGSISPSGLFTAPGTGFGTVEISATLSADPDIQGSSTIVFGQCQESFFDMSGLINGREYTPITVFFDFSQDIWILSMAGLNYLLQFESNFLQPVTGGSYEVNDSFAAGTFNASLFSQKEDGDGGAELEIDIESGVIEFSNVTPTVAVGTFDLRAESNSLRIQGVFLAEPYEE